MYEWPSTAVVVRLVTGLLRRYARGEAAAMAPFVTGRRVRDLGAGEAYVGAELRRAGRWVCRAQVGPFHVASGPWVVYDGVPLAFADHACDTTVVLLTLHHCPQVEAVLDEALRVTRARLVARKSVYRRRLGRVWIELLEPRVNRRRHGRRMPAAVDVRRPEAWRALFEARGLRVSATRWTGPAWERRVHHPLLLVLDRPGPVRARRVACRVAGPGASGNARRPGGKETWNATT